MVEPTVVPQASEGVGKQALGHADKLGLRQGMVVQELGWDEDCDEELRSEVMDAIDGDLIEEAVEEAVDLVLLWQRDDTDVADSLVDALRDLSPSGWIWLLTPRLGRSGYIDPADVQEGTRVSGLVLTQRVDVSPDWQASRVVRPKGNRR